jgi:MSHA biogenesis protein MshL
MTIQPSRFTLPLLALLLGACSHSAFRSDPTRDQIESELRQARDQKTVDAATEKALLPPLAVVSPVQEVKEPRFDLSIVNAPAQQVFMAIVSGTRYNMLIGPEVSGHISISLKDVTVREALDSIRELYGYEYRIQGNRISIQPNTLQTRVFPINYLSAIRAGETELRVTSSAVGSGNPQVNTNYAAYPNPNQGAPSQQGSSPNSQQPSTITTRVRTTSKNDFWDSLTTALQTIVGTEGGRNVVVTANSGVVLVRAFPGEIRAVENYLRAIQAIADRQVMLEAKIVEVSLNDAFQAGVNWATFNGVNNRGTLGNMRPNTTLVPTGATDPTLSNPGVSSIPGVAGNIATAAASATNLGFFGLALQTSNFAALINFLETQGTVSVLSSPRVATLNNQKAVLKVGTDELYVTNVTTNTTTNVTGNSTFSPTVTLQPYFSGISLDVTPQIDEEDNIILHIHPAVSTVQEKEKNIDLGTLGQFKLPLAASTVNESDSVVRARDGLIVAIGGLMSQTSIIDRSGMPGTLGSDAGTLLGQRARATQKRELVILIKPTLIRDSRVAQRDLEAITERIQKMGY